MSTINRIARKQPVSLATNTTAYGCQFGKPIMLEAGTRIRPLEPLEEYVKIEVLSGPLKDQTLKILPTTEVV